MVQTFGKCRLLPEETAFHFKKKKNNRKDKGKAERGYTKLKEKEKNRRKTLEKKGILKKNLQTNLEVKKRRKKVVWEEDQEEEERKVKEVKVKEERVREDKREETCDFQNMLQRSSKRG
jgi:hypothetical protein